MALLNFGAESQVKLGKILGSFDTTIQERVVRSQTGYIENQYFQVTEQVDIEAEGEEESSTEFKAIEVQPNGNPVENGIVFDSDATPSTNVADPIYLPNLKFNSELFSGSVEVGKAYTVEEVDSDTFGEASDWFIIPKGGAGGGATYGIILDQSLLNQDLYPPIAHPFYYMSTYTTVDRPPSTVVDQPSSTPISVATLDMSYYSTYGELPVDFTLTVFLAEGGSYMPFDMQTYCWGVVVSNSNIDPDHPNDNYEMSINTDPYANGLDLGIVNVKAPNIGYGKLGTGSKQNAQYIKELKAWFIAPATFGAY